MEAIMTKKQRLGHLYASRILLRQLTGVEVYSTGMKILTGVALDEYRQETLARIILLKDGPAAHHRFPVMARIIQNVVNQKSFLGPEGDETTGPWLARILTKYTSGNDMGSIDRAKVTRRILRKHFPQAWETVPVEHRFNHKERTHLYRARNAHEWELSCDLPLPNMFMTLSKGHDVDPTPTGFEVTVGMTYIEIDARNVRKRRGMRTGVQDIASAL